MRTALEEGELGGGELESESKGGGGLVEHETPVKGEAQ